jgi:signal transduction histidine kinase
VLSDMMMPRLDGFGLLRAIRGTSGLEDLPVILLSARAGEEATVEGLEAGADDYLIKPFTARELIARLQSHLRIAALRRQAATDLRTALGLRTKVLGIVAHDLKSPLTAVRVLAQLVLRHLNAGLQDPQELAKMANSIDHSSRRMVALVSTLEDAARLQVGEALQLNIEDVDLIALIHEGVADFVEANERAGLVNVLTDQPHIFGRWDPGRLGQVLDNLLSNALKYSPRQVSVQVAVGTDAEGIWFSVQDHGTGIPRGDVPRVFDSYWRATNVDAGIPGAGLGLASVAHIVAQHGGRVDVVSEEGSGSTFTVHLPLEASHTQPAYPS